MRIDTQRNTYRIWLRRLFMTISFTLVMVLLIFVSWFEDPELWFTKYHLIGLVGVIYVLVNIFFSMQVPYFLAYSDHGEMIILRYYPLSLFNSKKHSIEIPKLQFVKYELKPFFFGRHQKIILYQHFRNRLVGYPPISLSALEMDDRDRILASLLKSIKS